MAFVASVASTQHGARGNWICGSPSSSVPAFAARVATIRRAQRTAVTKCEVAPPESRPADVPFEIRGFSLANVGLALGLGITVVSFASYFSSSGTSSATSLGFVYGVPILLIGFALKYAELQPVPLSTTSDLQELRKQKATDTQKKIVSDVTRHRYGDEAHLSATVSALGLVPRGSACPELLRIAERNRDGSYVLALEFYSVETSFSQWEDRLERMERFFGPDVTIEVEKLNDEKRLVELRIISSL